MLCETSQTQTILLHAGSRFKYVHMYAHTNVYVCDIKCKEDYEKGGTGQLF